MTALRRLVVVTALVATTTVGVAVVALAPSSAVAEDCVGLVVDGSRLPGGGEVSTFCVQGDPTSGVQVLRDAGVGIRVRPDGLICEINGAPACTDTSLTTYWSYWYREPGSSSWVYSNLGAAAHDPKPGSTEAWVWQDGGREQPPGIAQDTICPPPAPPPPAPEPTPPASSLTPPPPPPPAGSATPRATTGPNASAPPTASQSGPSQSPGAAGTPSASDPTAKVTGRPTDSPRVESSTTASDPSSSPSRANASPASAREPADDQKLPVSAFAGLGLIAAVGVAALVVARRTSGAP